MYIIRLERVNGKCLYVSICSGDPGRTHTRWSAKEYKTRRGAKSALTQIRKKYGREFKNAEIFLK